MRNAVIFLLLVVIAVLVFLLVRGRKPSEPSVTTSSFVTPSPTDRSSGKTLQTRGCEARLGKDNKICVISIEYLQDMESGGKPDDPIEVRHKDTILWVSWNGESLSVNPMKAIDCMSHKPVTLPGNPNPSLIDQQSGSGSARYAHVTENKDNDGYCYKTDIDVTVGGQKKGIDPHIFDGGP